MDADAVKQHEATRASDDLTTEISVKNSTLAELDAALATRTVELAELEKSHANKKKQLKATEGRLKKVTDGLHKADKDRAE